MRDDRRYVVDTLFIELLKNVALPLDAGVVRPPRIFQEHEPLCLPLEGDVPRRAPTDRARRMVGHVASYQVVVVSNFDRVAGLASLVRLPERIAHIGEYRVDGCIVVVTLWTVTVVGRVTMEAALLRVNDHRRIPCVTDG